MTSYFQSCLSILYSLPPLEAIMVFFSSLRCQEHKQLMGHMGKYGKSGAVSHAQGQGSARTGTAFIACSL